jgi:hypothetical protein
MAAFNALFRHYQRSDSVSGLLLALKQTTPARNSEVGRLCPPGTRASTPRNLGNGRNPARGPAPEVLSRFLFETPVPANSPPYLKSRANAQGQMNAEAQETGVNSKYALQVDAGQSAIV